MNPRKLTDDQFFALVADRRAGLTYKALSAKYHVSTGTASDLYHGKCTSYPPVPDEPLPPVETRRELLTAKRLREQVAAKRLGLAMPVFKRTIGEVWEALEDIERRALARRAA